MPGTNCPDAVSRLVISEVYPESFLVCGGSSSLTSIDEAVIGLRASEADLIDVVWPRKHLNFCVRKNR